MKGLENSDENNKVKLFNDINNEITIISKLGSGLKVIFFDENNQPKSWDSVTTSIIAKGYSVNSLEAQGINKQSYLEHRR